MQISNGELASSVRAKLNVKLAEGISVKEYGAVGGGVLDDGNAIYNAIQAAAVLSGIGGTSGATVLFPSDSYLTGRKLQNDVGGAVRLCGSGKNSTVIFGNIDGFVVNSNIPDGNGWNSDPTTAGFITHIEHLTIKNTHALNANLVGALRYSTNYAGGLVHSVVLQGAVGCDAATNNFATTFIDVDFTSSTESKAGTVGCYAGQTSFIGCSFTLFGEGLRAFSSGVIAMACRFETNLIGMMLGRDPLGNVRTLANSFFAANSFERNDTPIYVLSLSSSKISSMSPSGSIGVAHYISAASYSGGTGKVTATSNETLDSFGWTSGTRPIAIENSTPDEYNTKDFGTGGHPTVYVTATRTGTNTFTYAPTGSAPGAYSGSASWSFKPQYGIRVRDMQNSSIENFTVGFTVMEGVGIDLLTDGLGTGTSNQLINVSGGVGGWAAPTFNNKASYTMSGCDTVTNFGMGFASLPGQSQVSETTPREGMKFYITDANTATLGANVTGSGSPNTHGWVGRNATDWTLQSK